MSDYLFDIPYNFDKNLPSLFSEEDKKNINCFYFPPPSTMYNSVVRVDFQYKTLPKEKEAFSEHVKILNQFKSNSCKLLLQKPDILIEKKEIEEYVKMGIRRFCVGSINQAMIIKSVDENLEVTASILMQVDEDLLKNYSIFKKYFDNIVLPFNYCNDINKVKSIAKNFPHFNYSIICNSLCSRSCRGLQHWLLPPDYKGNMNILCPDDRKTNSAFINPKDLKKYTNYIKNFKLVDRMMPSKQIYHQFKTYLGI